MKKIRRKRIFLDYASITPIRKEVIQVMNDISQNFANPSSIYLEGILAKEKLEEARKIVSNILSISKDGIVFTSSGTESNNLAILGIFQNFQTKKFRPHIITTSIEHSSILEVCKEIERRGGEVTIIQSGKDGLISPKDIISALKENTVLVSVMYANNEIGTIQSIDKIGKLIKEYRIKNNKKFPYFHTDACQSSLYLSLNMEKLTVDLMTLDGIKMYGPRGVGILAFRPNVKMQPIIFGGGQENNLRSGTENLSAIVGIAHALKIGQSLREKESIRLTSIRNYAMGKILKAFPQSSLNGSMNRLPNNINICFPNYDAEFLVISLDVLGISVSYSSSCQIFKEDSSSYVISAIGKKDCSSSSLRITLGKESTKKDIDYLLLALKKVLK